MDLRGGKGIYSNPLNKKLYHIEFSKHKTRGWLSDLKRFKIHFEILIQTNAPFLYFELF